MSNSQAEESDKRLEKLARKDINAQRLVPLQDEIDGKNYRSRFARDRDRIIYSTAFRRLMHKTQLYLSIKGTDHKRTRMSHTIEVVTIARAIAKKLKMNEELVEAIAYGHDIGHAPFGHAGENQLNSIANGNETIPARIQDKVKNETTPCIGDFKHNYQSVRILSFLEDYHPHQEDDKKIGLNLTFQTLEGILKHTKIYEKGDEDKRILKFPCVHEETSINRQDSIFDNLSLKNKDSISIEGQIVSIADEIAQVTHDIDDGLQTGALTYEDILNCSALVDIITQDKMRFPNGAHSHIDNEYRQHQQVLSSFVNYFVLTVTEMMKTALSVYCQDDNSDDDKVFPAILPAILEIPAYKQILKLKDEKVMNHIDVIRMDKKGEFIIRHLFDAYISDIRQLPDEVFNNYGSIKKIEFKRIGKDGFDKWFKEVAKIKKIQRLDKTIIDTVVKHIENDLKLRHLKREIIDDLFPYLFWDNDFIRAIIDYIAGMTDSFAESEYSELYMGSNKWS
ncbi:Deoxyguanosinetriphosphate triphosphohydrolase [Candidatus Magnetobacterium bavaricum]|uniref:Deoxyguanosinetriphosphate triphosphohydrolase n=1 Tax=Candidatus Magnetobacterium bavaricum TaxID=29290 RepID=A0A0F3GWK5_9BACT|nr:Deoxyguanosinetriphosphate triphosphohydrolase [Candidatus Magnetobacterium bavaricum]